MAYCNAILREYVKRNFDPARRSDFDIPFAGVADDEAAGIEQGFLTVTHAEVGSIFTPIIQNILRLINGQIKRLRSDGKTVAGIILVGGFGQSKCLRTQVKKYFADQQSASPVNFMAQHKGSLRSIEVFQPQNAWTAVAKGAVLRGLEGVELVLSRKSRCHYGVICWTHFDGSIHPLSCKQWDALDEVWRAEDRIKWFIGKGQTVSSTAPVLLPFCRKHLRGQGKTATPTLVVCDNDDAPNGFEKNTQLSARVLAQMVVNLNEVPAYLWRDHRNTKGTMFQQLSYELGMQIESAGLKFDMRIDDVVYGDVTVAFD